MKGVYKTLEEILVVNSSYATVHLKRRLLKIGLLRNECYHCPVKTVWNNKPLSLHLEHKNGIHSDCRIQNLEMLCPNCHSQTLSYGGKNKGINK